MDADVRNGWHRRRGNGHPDDQHVLRTLLDRLGKAECLRLGFVGKTDNETLFVTAVGFGFLLDVCAVEVDNLAEAYAAGFQQGYTQAKDGY